MSVNRKTVLDKIFVVARQTEAGNDAQLLITALEQIIEDIQELGQEELKNENLNNETGDHPGKDTHGCLLPR